VKKILPEFIKTINKFDQNNYEFIVSQASSVSKKLFSKILQTSNKKIVTLENVNYEMMKHCDVLAVTSGTATIETAFLGTPFIIVYKTSKLSYQIGKRFIKIDKIGLPNIILKKKVIPELIQDEVYADLIYSELNKLLSDEIEYKKIKHKLTLLHEILGNVKTSESVAKLIRDMLNE